MSTNHKLVWNKCLVAIKKRVNTQSFETWFAPIIAHSYQNDTLTIRVPNQFFYEWLEGHYLDLLREVIHEELGAQGRLSYQMSKKKMIPGQQAKATNTQVKKATKEGKASHKMLHLNPSFTFDSFVVGDCNQLVHAAAEAVANNLGKTSFNPLLIHGGVGQGKTHIVQSIAHHVREYSPDKKIVYTTTEEFTSQFIQQVRQNKAQEFMHSFFDLDLLIIDDIQFLQGKEKTQEIFFHVFNHLHQHGKQIVMTSDCAPSDLAGFEKRLLSRFKWGLTVSLQKPDLETRIAIIQVKLTQHRLQIAADLIQYIASHITTNIRELEGVLISLMAYAELEKRAIDIALVKQVLQNIVTNAPLDVRLDIKYLQKTVSAYYDISLEALKGRSRKREVVVARHVAMYLAKKYTDYSLKAIGYPFGRKDHSTVSYALRAVENLMDTDRRFRLRIEEIEKLIKRDIPSIA